MIINPNHPYFNEISILLDIKPNILQTMPFRLIRKELREKFNIISFENENKTISSVIRRNNLIIKAKLTMLTNE